MSAVSIDAHQHFWDPALADYPWMTGQMTPIARRFGPQELRPLLAASRIDRTILVQARASLDESRELLATAASSGLVAGVVAWVDLTDPAVGDTIAGLRAAPGGSALVGIRHPVHDEADPAWLSRPDVLRGLAFVERAGLTYDLLVRARELPAALAAVRAIPGLRFVIDHLAKPPLREGDLSLWTERLRPFAGLPNVWCKLSGLVTEADWASWTVTDLEPARDVVLEVFGPGRLMFGSDWPVCLLAAPYATVLETARELTAKLSPSDRRSIFGGSALRAYSLDDLSG